METAASFEARSAPLLYPTTGKEITNPSLFLKPTHMVVDNNQNTLM
jgi:hypothetical protein